jgi:hypothetical protein
MNQTARQQKGEAALFEDIKAKDEDGATTFTTAARVVCDGTHALALDIRWGGWGAFWPVWGVLGGYGGKVPWGTRACHGLLEGAEKMSSALLIYHHPLKDPSCTPLGWILGYRSRRFFLSEFESPIICKAPDETAAPRVASLTPQQAH